MKNFSVFCFLFALPLASGIGATCDCQDLQSRIERLERAVFSGSGTVKTKNLNNQTNTSTGEAAANGTGNEPTMSAEEKEKVMKELEKLKGNQEENQKYLDQLMKEN